MYYYIKDSMDLIRLEYPYKILHLKVQCITINTKCHLKWMNLSCFICPLCTTSTFLLLLTVSLVEFISDQLLVILAKMMLYIILYSLASSADFFLF